MDLHWLWTGKKILCACTCPHRCVPVHIPIFHPTYKPVAKAGLKLFALSANQQLSKDHVLTCIQPVIGIHVIKMIAFGLAKKLIFSI